jgi:putative hydrolase of the HAD superfamily
MLTTPTVALIDADNTLWDTDAVFRKAQLALLSLVESVTHRRSPTSDRLQFVRDYDQALALAHHLHLRYPPQLLVRALEVGLDGVPADIAARDAIAGRLARTEFLADETVQSIVATFIDVLSDTPPLLPSVQEAISAALAAGFTLYVMTEGRIERQRKLMELHGLVGAFEGVWELTKTREQFARLLVRFPQSRVVVIGDQLDRDIVPSKAAGCVTVFVPSRFTPSWNEKGPQESADFVAPDLLEAMTWCITTAAA